jgi:hypothetical protein
MLPRFILHHRDTETQRTLENAPLDAILKRCDLKIDQQTDVLAREAQVREQLRLIDRRDSFRALELDYNRTLYHQVHPVTAIQANALVLDREIYLARESKLSQGQLMAEAFFISRFEQSGAEGAMNFDRSANDGLGQIRKQISSLRLCVSVVS